MSILKGTHSGINAKLTPTYIVSFGYTYAGGLGENVYIKKDKHIFWDDYRKKFVFIFEKEISEKYAIGGSSSYKEQYEYTFDTYPELKILEQYWFSEDENVVKIAYDKIVKKSKRLLDDLFSFATSIFSKTFVSDLVSVQHMSHPTANISFFNSLI